MAEGEISRCFFLQRNERAFPFPETTSAKTICQTNPFVQEPGSIGTTDRAYHAAGSGRAIGFAFLEGGPVGFMCSTAVAVDGLFSQSCRISCRRCLLLFIEDIVSSQSPKLIRPACRVLVCAHGLDGRAHMIATTLCFPYFKAYIY